MVDFDAGEKEMRGAISSVVCLIGGLVLLSPVTSRSIEKRSVKDLNPHEYPCYFLEVDNPTANVNLLNVTRGLQSRAQGILQEARDIKTHVTSDYIQDTTNIGWLDLQNFMDTEEMQVTMEHKAAAIADIPAAIKSYYNLLFEHVMYVEHMRTTGEVSQLAPKGDLRERLLVIERKLYSMICTLKLTLLTLHVDSTNTITPDVLHPNFMGLNQNLMMEAARAYIVMRDNEMLMTYLTTMMQVIENAVASQPASE